MKLLQMIAAAFVLAFATPASFADSKAESFVQQNANVALSVLNDKTLSSSQREAKFGEYMDRFASMEAIARRVIGLKAREMSEPEFRRYFAKFRAYSLSVYQVHFDQFRGEALRVTGSKPGDVPKQWIVESVIASSQTGKDTKVYWDVIQSKDGNSYRVRDIGIDLGGSPRWLAVEQTEEFAKFLSAPGSSMDKLLVRMDQLVAENARKAR